MACVFDYENDVKMLNASASPLTSLGGDELHIRQLLKELRSVTQLRMKTPWLRHFNTGICI